MSTFVNSLVILCPAHAISQAQALGPLLGNSNSEFGVPLSPNGSAPATYYGLHAVATDQYINLIRDMPADDFEARYTQPDGTKLVTAAQVTALRAALVISALPKTELDGSAHFDAVLEQAGLKRSFA